MKVLVVDDVETDRALAGKVVEMAGFKAIYAKDGEEAVGLAKSEMPGLILMDVVMPVMDGFATLRTIKKDPETAHIPIIMVTSKSGTSDKLWAVKQGAADLVGKPFNAGTLLPVIKQHAKL
jgi:twitching motility two-component system response regulator PilH